MPTGNRAALALQSVHYFLRQDYPHCELIIVDDGSDDLASRLPSDERIHYLRVPAGLSIGAKRNRACAAAHGAWIAQWDDDDWYAPQRLTAQVEPLLAGRAEISALKTWLLFDLPGWEFWRCAPELHRRLFVEDVHGGTLVYARHVWERLARYPDRSLAEDAYFLRRALAQGARLYKLSGDELFLYVRHGANSWKLPYGQSPDPLGWQTAPDPRALAADRAFYTHYRTDYKSAGLAAGVTAIVSPTTAMQNQIAPAIDSPLVS
jgi:glycosyltransferase involved in cell wall biosynthesis